MPRLVEFEGRRIEVPDDATDAEVAAILSSQPAAPAAPALSGALDSAASAIKSMVAPAPAAPEQSLVDSVMGGADYAAGTAALGATGFRKGLATVAGLPVDAMNNAPRLLNLLPGVDNVGPISQKPFLGSDSIESMIAAPTRVAQAALGRPMVDPKPQDTLQRVVQRVGQEIGAAAVPAAGAMATAGRVGVEGARKLPTLARMFVEPAAVSPGSFIGKETGAATAAGLGAAGANELTGKAQAEAEGRPVTATQNLGDFFGALGGVGLSSGMLAVAKPLATAVGSMMGSPRLADSVVRDVAVDEIARAAGVPPNAQGIVDTGPLADRMQNGRRVAETIPGFQESTADRTGNAGLAAMEYGRQSGANAGQFAARRDANTKAIDTAINRAEPQGNPGALRSELDLERERRLTDATVLRQNAQDAFDKTVNDLRPTLNAEARGADIRAALEDASARVKAAVDELYRPVNESAAKVDTAPLAEQFGSVTDNLSTAETRRFKPSEADIPGEFAQPAKPPVNTGLLDQNGQPIMREQPQADSSQPLREVTGIRNALTDQAREASSAGRTNEARIIGRYVSALDQYVEQAIPTELRSQWDAARAARRDMADRFERPQTAIAQTLDKREGMYAQPNSAVPGKFVQSDQGRIADFEALMRETGSDQRVQTAVRDTILQDVKDRGLLDKPDMLADYLDQYKTVFSKFPDLRKQLGSAKALREQLGAATDAETSLVRELGLPDGSVKGRGIVAKYLQYGDENAERAMRYVIGEKDPAKAVDDLLGFVGNEPKAVEGARKVFWDIMQKDARSGGETTKTISGNQPWMPAALKRFTEDPRIAAVAERLYRDNPEHWQRVKDIADSIQGVDIRNRAKAPNTSGTAQGVNESFLPTTETLASRIFAVERGVVSPAFAAVNVIGIMARKATRNAQVAAVNQAIDRALLDPDWAEKLLRENNPANRAALARSAKGWMGNEAGTLLDMLDDDPDAEVKKKAMEK